ncbi:MAG: hypothetical protein FGO69_08700 [Methanobacterium sp.]|nr:MAG: hypothetical protein FGO69_08700 [Methanobacterium sp.]
MVSYRIIKNGKIEVVNKNDDGISTYIKDIDGNVAFTGDIVRYGTSFKDVGIIRYNTRLATFMIESDKKMPSTLNTAFQILGNETENIDLLEG